MHGAWRAGGNHQIWGGQKSGKIRSPILSRSGARRAPKSSATLVTAPQDDISHRVISADQRGELGGELRARPVIEVGGAVAAGFGGAPAALAHAVAAAVRATTSPTC
jgi:hypothetical protein